MLTYTLGQAAEGELIRAALRPHQSRYSHRAAARRGEASRPSGRLPTIWSCRVITVKNAYEQLHRRGVYLQHAQRSGYFVSREVELAARSAGRRRGTAENFAAAGPAPRRGFSTFASGSPGAGRTFRLPSGRRLMRQTILEQGTQPAASRRPITARRSCAAPSRRYLHQFRGMHGGSGADHRRRRARSFSITSC